MIFLITLLIAGALILISLSLFPLLTKWLGDWQAKKEIQVAAQLDNLYHRQNPKEIMRLYFILPPVLGVCGYLFFNSGLTVIAGVVLGLFVPNLILRMRDAQRKMKFQSQLLDGIMLLSSSLKGGLSFLQALEVLAEEMPAPMGQEIGLVVREDKLGVPLEQGLKHLDQRMKLEDLTSVVNSVLVARETGGDLNKVLSRLSVTIRDNRKLKDNIRTLTLQGRMQGAIMSLLPFLFVFWVFSFNRHHFDVMFQSELGRMLLLAAVILQAVGMILIRKFSAIKM